MARLNIYFFLFVTMLTSSAFCNDTRLTYLVKGSIASGAVDRNDNDLQEDQGLYMERGELAYLNGDTKGALLGFGYGSEYAKWTTVQSSERNSGRFKSRYDHVFLMIGYWLLLSKQTFAEIIISPGYGHFKFQQYDPIKGPVKRINGIGSLGAEVRLVYNIKVIRNAPSIDLIGGFGFSNTNVPSFTYDGEKNKSSDFSTIPYLSFGLGVRF